MPQLKKAIELGGYFSINPSMLKTKSGLEVINAVPIDRMLLETDAPFTFKAQHIEDIEKELRRVVLKISDIVKTDMTDVFYENSREVFRY
jgi:TatD DNase family protein